MATYHRPPLRPVVRELEIEILEPEEWPIREPIESPHPGPEQPETEEEIPLRTRNVG